MILNTGKNVELAKLMNCSWNYENFACEFEAVAFSCKFKHMQKGS